MPKEINKPETLPEQKALADVIRQYMAELEAEFPADGPEDSQRDSYHLLRSLARLVQLHVSPMDIHDVFGAPGDWGYSHPIGKALNKLYNAYNASLDAKEAKQ